MAPKTKVSSQFQTSPNARDWAAASEDLNSAFTLQNPQDSLVPPNLPPSTAGASPQNSSNSGERCAGSLDLIFSLSCFFAALTLSLETVLSF